MSEIGDSRLQHGFNAETILLRSRRGEIAPVMVKLTDKRQIQTAWRDWQHSRLWDSLTPEQQHAWNDILRGFQSIAGVCASRGFDPSLSQGRGISGDDYGAAIQADYKAWADRVRHRRMKFDMILNMLVQGMSIRESARTAKPPTSPHLARLALIAALDIYSEMKGRR